MFSVFANNDVKLMVDILVFFLIRCWCCCCFFPSLIELVVPFLLSGANDVKYNNGS